MGVERCLKVTIMGCCILCCVYRLASGLLTKLGPGHVTERAVLGMVGERKRCKAVFCFLNVLFIANHSFLLIFWEHTVFKSCFQKLLCLTWKTSTVMIEFICMKIFYCSQITCINIEDWSNLFCAFCFHLVLCQNISLTNFDSPYWEP